MLRWPSELPTDIPVFFEELAFLLAARGIAAAGVDALELSHALSRIEVVSLPQGRRRRYPILTTILSDVADACLAESVELRQLRRIVFGDHAVSIEVTGRGSETARFSWPIDLTDLDT